MSGGGGGEQPPAVGVLADDLALEGGKLILDLADLGKIILEIGLDYLVLVLHLVGGLDNLHQIALEGLMVTAVHAEEVIGDRETLQGMTHLQNLLLQRVGIGGQLHCVAVPVGEEHADDLAAVGCLPKQLGIGDTILLTDLVISADIVQTSAKYGVVDAKALADLGCLTDIAKCIGEIAAHQRICTEGFGQLDAVKHIADVCLAAGEELILQNIPRADLDAVFRNQLLQAISHMGTDLQIVLHGNELTVHMIVGVLVGLFHLLNDGVKQLHQLHPVGFKGLIPLTVPVGVGNNVQLFLHKGLLFTANFADLMQILCNSTISAEFSPIVIVHESREKVNTKRRFGNRKNR